MLCSVFTCPFSNRLYLFRLFNQSSSSKPPSLTLAHAPPSPWLSRNHNGASSVTRNGVPSRGVDAAFPRAGFHQIMQEVEARCVAWVVWADQYCSLMWDGRSEPSDVGQDS